jgi:MHS family shikimate/dehydroshikimate transporter-like MFS transporter
MYIRTSLAESPLFRRAEASGAQRNPLISVLRSHPREILLGCGAKLAESTVFTVYAVIIGAYAVNHGMPRAVMTVATLVAILLELVSLPLFGVLADRIGRKPVYVGGTLISLAAAWPAFAAVYYGETGYVWLTMIVALTIGHSAMYGPQASFFAELFPVRVRATGVGFVQQIGALIGSLGTLGAGWLLTLGGGSPWLLCAYISSMSVISFMCVLMLRETVPLIIPDKRAFAAAD